MTSEKLSAAESGALESNRVFCLLRSLRVIDPESIVRIHPRVRDRDDISVLRCMKSGVIFLSRSDHIDVQHYVVKDVNPELVSGTTIAHPKPLDDDHRRAEQIRALVRDRRWLDFGTGPGGILDLLCNEVRSYAAVEPNAKLREDAKERGHLVHASVEDIPEGTFDLITMFHVFEHLVDPINILRSVRERLAPQGQLWIEVPHARDFLLDMMSCKDFMNFTFWSEHLVLHTRQSLDVFIREAGLLRVAITGFQRYPLSNHLHWLTKGAPGGHSTWAFLNDAQLSSAYASTLTRLDQTDTLLAIASTTP